MLGRQAFETQTVGSVALESNLNCIRSGSHPTSAKPLADLQGGAAAVADIDQMVELDKDLTADIRR